MNLSDLFAIAAAGGPEGAAVVADGESLSHAALGERAARLAAGLVQRGLRPGDRVAFFLGNRPEFVVAFLAVLRAGGIVVPINLAYQRREIGHILSDARPRILLTERGHEATLGAHPDVEVLFADDLRSLERAPDLAPLVDGDDLALILYTSGTTGKSKGAMLTHDNIAATVTALLAAWAWERSDVLLLALPLFHTHGLVVGLTCALAAGATVRLQRKFDAAAVIAELDAGVATMFFGVPTMYVRLVSELESRRGVDLSRMRLFCSGSAPLAPETFARFRALTGHAILERYGMTETGMLLSNPYVGDRRAGTVGTPLPGVSARLEGGELLVRGANVFAGYWEQPEKTAESFATDSEGRRWFRTGDLASRDPQTGYFSLLGRRTELILSGGFNVYPREIEEVLEAFPGVREAAVVGRAHPEFGQSPVAFLVMESPLTPPVESELVSWCRDQLAAFKVPRGFHVVDSLPRNALGKVQKHLLPG